MNTLAVYGNAIFCDDIRNEHGGKLTLVGVYPTVMFVHGEFPFTLPKFGISISYHEAAHIAGQEPVMLKVFLPGDPDDKPSVDAPLPAAKSDNAADPYPPDIPPTRYVRNALQVMFTPLTINKEGRIKVLAMRADEEIRLGLLPVLKAPKNQPGAPPIS